MSKKLETEYRTHFLKLLSNLVGWKLVHLIFQPRTRIWQNFFELKTCPQDVRQAQQEKSGLWIFSTSNYASLCEKWQIYLKTGHKLCRNHVFVFIFRGEKIKFEAELKLSVGDDISADIEFNGEATEAAKTFVNNGYLEALNGKIERAWWVFGKTKGILNGNDVDILFKKKIQEQISNLYRKIYSRLSDQILNDF